LEDPLRILRTCIVALCQRTAVAILL
jgi:hypothetical protein